VVAGTGSSKSKGDGPGAGSSSPPKQPESIADSSSKVKPDDTIPPRRNGRNPDSSSPEDSFGGMGRPPPATLTACIKATALPTLHQGFVRPIRPLASFRSFSIEYVLQRPHVV